MTGLERLGESDAWGETMLWVLERDGWSVTRRPSLGEGSLVIASCGNVSIRVMHESFVGAARIVLDLAGRSRRLAAA